MSGGGTSPNVYQYGQSPNVDTSTINQSIKIANAGDQASGLYNQVAPSYTPSLQGTSYTPQQGVNAGAQISGSVGGLPGYANQALTAGFDPQKGLYNQELQQVQDQSRVAGAARGVAMSPYGAGVENQAVGNFNNQWGQQQLANQAQASGTAGNLLGSYEKGIGGGQALAQTASQGGIQSLTQMLQNSGLSTAQLQQVVQDYLQYLQGGTQAASAQGQLQNQADANNNSALGGLGSGIGSLLTTPLQGTALGSLGSLFAL